MLQYCSNSEFAADLHFRGGFKFSIFILWHKTRAKWKIEVLLKYVSNLDWYKVTKHLSSLEFCTILYVKIEYSLSFLKSINHIQCGLTIIKYLLRKTSPSFAQAVLKVVHLEGLQQCITTPRSCYHNIKIVYMLLKCSF